MIYELQITTAADSGFLLNEVSRKFSWLKQRGCTLLINKTAVDRSNSIFIDLQLKGAAASPHYKEEDIVYIFKHQLSEFLAEHIIRDWENKLAWKEITKKGRHILPGDKFAIMDKAINFLKHCNSNESLNLLMNYGRKNKISHRIFDYIYYHHNLVVEGFINFCMQDYLTEIRFAVDLACEELRNEKEYNEFVKLLRYFVDTQPPLAMEVNIMMDCKGNFVLWDGNGSSIEKEHINYFIDDISRGEISLDDILVSILITIAPRRIILHNTEHQMDSDSVQMIKKVFDKRIAVCNGCERCLGYHRTEVCITKREK